MSTCLYASCEQNVIRRMKCVVLFLYFNDGIFINILAECIHSSRISFLYLEKAFVSLNKTKLWLILLDRNGYYKHLMNVTKNICNGTNIKFQLGIR